MSATAPPSTSSTATPCASSTPSLKRDATDTTYKYTLLRALIEIAEQQTHHITSGGGLAAPAPHALRSDENCVSFTFGLIVKKHKTPPFNSQGCGRRGGGIERHRPALTRRSPYLGQSLAFLSSRRQ